MTGLMHAISRALEEAAVIDSCGIRRIIFQIVRPITKPALVTIIVMTFINVHSKDKERSPMIQNPILPGFNADPCICRKGDNYYVAVSSMEWFPGVPVYHSTDLKQWTLYTHILTDPQALEVMNLPSAKGIWAPCLTYCEAEDRFYLVYNVMYSHHARYFDVNNYLISAESLTGPWTKPVYLHSAGFDGSLFHDDDGRKYIVSMEWETRDGWHKPGCICLCEYDAAKKAIIGYPKRIFTGATKRGCIEGPHIYKRNGYYYLLCAEGGTGYGHCVTLSRSECIWGPYEAAPHNPILTSTADFDEMDNDDFLKRSRYNPGRTLQKAGHGSFVDTPNGEVYMVFHCGRPFLPELRCTLGREACIAKMEWTADDWLQKAGADNLADEYIEELSHIAAQEGAPLAPDVFSKKTGFPIEYYAQRQSMSNFARKSAEKWVLRGEESLSSLHRVSLLARRLTSLNAAFEATLEQFEPEAYQQYAGICLFYDNQDYILARKVWCEEEKSITLDLLRVKNGVREEIKGTRVRLENAPLSLRLQVSERETTFYWKQTDGSWRSIGPVFDTSEFSDEYCLAGEFTGTMLGLYCVDAVFHAKEAVFSDVEYEEE